jgi:zinc transport system permease protein
MEAIYLWFAGLAQAGLLPEIFEHPFMVRGLLAALMIGPILGGMGTMVVAKKLSFFTQTIGNAAMSGVAIGLLIGEPLDQTYGGLYGFCLIVALLMTFLKNRTRFASDTVIGVVLAQTLGIGIIMLVLVTKQFNIHQVESVLFGSLITITDLDLLVLLITAAIAAVTGFWIFNRSMLVSFNPVMARARGFSPIISDYIFVVILTMVVVASLKLVGALLVLVLVVVPAAGAQNIAGNLKSFFWISTALSTISTVFGLVLSGFLPVPTGGCIVLVSSLIFYGTLLCKPLLGRSGVNQGE